MLFYIYIIEKSLDALVVQVVRAAREIQIVQTVRKVRAVREIQTVQTVRKVQVVPKIPTEGD